MNAFVPCKFAAHFLQIPHVKIVLVESIVRYLFAFFQLWNVDNFNDMTDWCIGEMPGTIYESIT